MDPHDASPEVLVFLTPGWAGPACVDRDLRTVRGTFRVPTSQKDAPANAQVDIWAGLGGLANPRTSAKPG